jgi:hypothetical protein
VQVLSKMADVCMPVGLGVFAVVVIKSSVFWIKCHTAFGKMNKVLDE